SRRPSRLDCAGSGLARSTKAEFGNRADRRSLHRPRAQSISAGLSGLSRSPVAVLEIKVPARKWTIATSATTEVRVDTTYITLQIVPRLGPHVGVIDDRPAARHRRNHETANRR